jgi:hypothetical protein
MKLIETGTSVLVNLNGRRVPGVVAHVMLSSVPPKYTRARPRYTVHCGVVKDDRATLTVTKPFFELIDGKPNPDFQGVKSYGGG